MNNTFTMEEYEKVKDMTYLEYCDYLNKKYSTSIKDGLFRHHTFENVKANLSNREVSKNATYEERNTITYCNFMEHLFLHILIGEQTDARKALGLGGAVNYIVPQISKYFEYGIMEYSPSYYKGLDRQVFDILCSRLDNAIENTSIALEHNAQLCMEVNYKLDTINKAMVVMGTGLGKTTTALDYLWRHKCRGLVITPNNLIKNGWEEYSDWVDVDTYQGFANNYERDYSKYGLIILDEVHHAGAKVWGKGVQYLMNNNIKVLGLTATPKRSDGINVEKVLFNNAICEGYSVEDGIERGLIHPFSYITALYDTNGISESYSNCENKELVGQLDLAINNNPSLKDIFIRDMPKGKRKGIIFIQAIEDEQLAKSIMMDIYPNVEYRVIHSKMSQATINNNREWFESTDEGYLIAVNMVSEGAHYKGVNTLIMFRRTNSYLVFTQQLGRIITLTQEENPNAVVFDLVNNIENIEYNNHEKDDKKYTIRRILNKLKNTDAFKSNQIIIKDESRDIVNAIRDIKKYNSTAWQAWEIDIIKKYYPTEGASGCYEALNNKWKSQYLTKYPRNLHTIAVYASQTLKIFRCNLFWTEHEIEYLKNHYPNEGESCFANIDRSTPACSNMVRKLGITHDTEWTTDEDNILIRDYPKMGADCFYKIHRSRYACKNRARTLGLKVIKRPKPRPRDDWWSSDEIDILKEYYPYEGADVIKRLNNRTLGAIHRCARLNGIKYIGGSKSKKKVMCVETHHVYDSVQETGIMNVTKCCKNPTKTAGGYHWKFVDEQ